MKADSPEFKRYADSAAGSIGAAFRRAGADIVNAVSAFVGRKASVTRMRLQTLVMLRWMAVLGQTVTIIIVQYGFNHSVPIAFCAVPIAASFFLNVWLTLRYPATRRLSEREAALYMGWDILQLAVLLFFTGGLLNPFSILLLAPVTIAAGTLSRTSVVLLVLLSLACATALGGFINWHWPLPWPPEKDFDVPDIYEFGVYCALIIGLVFSSMFAWRISAEQNRMSDALAATEMVLAREQRLSAVGGLAAAAAHELGSPLATLSVVARELEREVGQGPLAGDIALLRSQTERCRAILNRLTLEAQAVAAERTNVPLRDLLEEVAAPHRGFGVDIAVTVETANRDEDPLRVFLPHRPEILHGLGNIIENAVDFARTQVAIEAFIDAEFIRVQITDDGPGFPREVLDRLGEPFLSNRPRLGKSGETPGETTAASIEEDHGMGLGFFIAKTLLERTGAKVLARNVAPGEPFIGRSPGATVGIVWVREDLSHGTV
jgi:two-component system, sensor histidine kinase RegB